MDRVLIFDTTLRDGEQSPGISLNTRDKLEIAEQLERLGVDIIEAGFPVTSPGDFEAVTAIAAKVKEPVIAALARAIERDIDTAWDAIKGAERPRIHTFINTSPVQMKYQLKKTPDEVLEMAVAAVRMAKSHCPDVEFSAMDASRSEPDFLHAIFAATIEAGATTINIPDTVGYAIPDDFGRLVTDIIENVKGAKDVVVSVHCHNDLGLAVANSVEAVKRGARQIECAVNGLGERAGNTSLEEVVMVLDTRQDLLGPKTMLKTEEIVRTSRLVSRLTGYPVQPNKAIVGANAFAHESGIHQDGVLKERTTFEALDPRRVGWQTSRIVLGKTSGRHGLKQRLEDLGYEMEEEQLNSAFERFKTLADKKHEITDDDLEAIIAEDIRAASAVYSLEYIKTSSGTNETPTAKIILKKDGRLIERTEVGDGQVDAACRAIDEAVGLEPRLQSYNVSAITGGLDAQGDVTIRLEIEGKQVLGRGVSTDIIEASAKAYLNAINKYLSK
ncbi:MAG: 2-isopropylmalate synthase [Actinomycetota bacterium]